MTPSRHAETACRPEEVAAETARGCILWIGALRTNYPVPSLPPSITMAGRASVVLRDQFEIAKRQGEFQSTSLGDLRENVVLALDIVRERLQPIDAAAAGQDIALLAARYFDWVSERNLLRDEAQELKRLLDHLDLYRPASTT